MKSAGVSRRKKWIPAVIAVCILGVWPSRIFRAQKTGIAATPIKFLSETSFPDSEHRR